jgi:hypothetical protein
MAKKIWVLEADQLPSETPRHNVKRAVADVLVRRLLARRIAKHLIQMLVVKSASQHPQNIPACFIDGPFGIGNLLPFAKIQNKQMAPERLHYEIPACGARTRLLRVRNVNYIPTPEEAAGCWA